jgi:signal transduction histidine kinase
VPGATSLERLAARTGSPLDVAFDALPYGILVCTPDGDRANAELWRIVRVTGSRGLGRRDLDRRLRPLDRGGTARRPSSSRRPVTAAVAGEPWPAQRMRLERADGTTGVVRVSARPLAFAGGSGAVVTVADETAAHEAERLRDAFLGIVGHELRSPISSILAAADLLRDDHLGADVRAEVAADLGEEAHRLHQLVEQLIGLADVRRSRDVMTDEPTHLAHLVTARIARWRARQPRLAIEIDLPDGSVPAVAGEEGYVAQALDILIDNAAKYAGTSKPLVVQLEAGDDEVRLHVLDHGPGLPDDAEPIFGLFWRAVPNRQSGRHAPPGHGIGLFVARSIVEALGGRIWARNRPDGGADVGFALPIARD